MKHFLSILFLSFLTIKSNAQNPSVNKTDTSKNKIVICSVSRELLANQNPLVIVNGKMKDNAYLQTLDINSIGSVNVLKGDDAIKEYGKKARNGVIVITTK